VALSAFGRHPEERSDEGFLFDFMFLPSPQIQYQVSTPPSI
jgi:hypothetical protein